MEKKLVIFVSGNGSNMENIASFFSSNKNIIVSHVLTNKETCNAIKKAEYLKIPVITFNKEELINGKVLNILKKINPDLIVLAGFLLKIPQSITHHFANKIVNIHPSLLPKYGGKGMYGKHVHKAVIEHNEKESGITIHYVNEHYDEGNIISQHSCKLLNNETVSTLQEKIHLLEMKHFPEAIKNILS